MAGRERNPRGEGERLRTTLLDVATELLAEVHDIDKLSVRAVTARAGVSPTALYLHFADKAALIGAVKDRCFTALTAQMTAAVAAEDEDDPQAQLRAVGRAYLAFAREQPGWYAVMFGTNFRDHFQAEDFEAGANAPMDAFGLLVAAVARCLDPSAGEQEAFELATILWAVVHGRASLGQAIARFPFPDEERWLTRIVAAVIAPASGLPGGRASD
ncbi:TetR/AcrR family transcriptional regulator [Patulibacter defluvii]|uniref:TetR/AcrR family transcriptional regulator n=1 Tax=Patulibacter defluvii TaxID=3095358 RepID=UPI002A766BCE|nr:TetR/AcrR family transcriptional regulator [Patulibacter sp. DM4]